MSSPHRSPAPVALGPLVLIALVVGAVAAAFAYTAGWLSPRYDLSVIGSSEITHYPPAGSVLI